MGKSIEDGLKRDSEEWKRYRAWIRQIDSDLRSFERWFDSGFQAVEADTEEDWTEVDD